MGSGVTATTYIYLIDNDDRIVSVSDNWLSFAQANQAAESCHPDRVVNASLWDFIDGVETKHLYEILMKNSRATNKSITVPFRCDAPDKRRYLELTITPVPQLRLEFASRVIREESRNTVDLLKAEVERSGQFVRMCSMCKKVASSASEWVEVETAVVTLKLFELDKLPRISHGLCPECFEVGVAEVEKLHGNASALQQNKDTAPAED
jgi:hypothetical protein